jgi:ABC-type nitrate/sulfonate/bicarbonate transport system substrate-binding protein
MNAHLHALWSATGSRVSRSDIFTSCRRSTLRALVGSLVIAIIVASTNCDGTKTSGKVYRVGLGPWIGFGPLYLAQNKGYFTDEGIKVELTVLTGLAERNSSLKSGKVDGLAAPVDYFVLSALLWLSTNPMAATGLWQKSQ